MCPTPRNDPASRWENMDSFVEAQRQFDIEHWARAAPLGVGDVCRLADIPADNPWSKAAVATAEATLLREFEDTVAMNSSGRIHNSFTQYLGEGLIFKFGGEWVRIPPDVAPELGEYGVRHGEFDSLSPVESLVREAVRLRSGSVWLSVLSYEM